MPRYDAILITTIKADSQEQAESFIQDFADGLSNTESAPFTGILDPREYDNEGQRVFYLHPLNTDSECGGAEIEWHLDATKETN